MKAIVLHFVVVASMTNNGKFTLNCLRENANDFCRFCGVNVKIKYGNFRKIPNTFPWKIYLNLQFKRSVKARHD